MGSLTHWFTPQMVVTARVTRPKPGAMNSIHTSYNIDRDSSKWAMVFCFHRCVSRKFSWKQNSHDSNWHSEIGYRSVKWQPNLTISYYWLLVNKFQLSNNYIYEHIVKFCICIFELKDRLQNIFCSWAYKAKMLFYCMIQSSFTLR